jgi:capsular exopolysaccharide synthesis family protein
MSEFFKALEQAERDRQREDQARTATAAPESRTTTSENGAPAAEPAIAKPPARPPAKPDVVAPAKAEVTAPAKAEVAAPVKPEVAASAKAEVTAPAKAEVAAPVKPEVAASAKAEAAAPAKAEVAAPAKPEVVAPAKAEAPPPASPTRYQSPSPASVFRPSLQAPERTRPRGRGGRGQPLLIALSDPNSIEADAYRTVRAKIELMPHDRASRHVAITSVTGGDGKSTSAANLAVVAAQGGRRVCLVDADLRRPTLHDVFGLPNVDGLTLALSQGRTLQAVARSSDIENLSVVVAGRSAHEGFQDLLTPQRLEKALRESEAAFDLVIFDTPPVISVADALNVAAACDGVILVVRSGSVPFSVLRRAISQIGDVKGRVLGVLLNRVDLRTTDADFYRHYRSYHTTGSKK